VKPVIHFGTLSGLVLPTGFTSFRNSTPGSVLFNEIKRSCSESLAPDQASLLQ